MQRRDYLLRMIEQMGRMIARIRSLILEGRHVEAGAELDRVALDGGVPLSVLIALDEASLEPLLTTGGEIDRPKCALFAEVLYLEWQRTLAMANPERAHRVAGRALLLYSLAYDFELIDAETDGKIEELRAGAG